MLGSYPLPGPSQNGPEKSRQVSQSLQEPLNPKPQTLHPNSTLNPELKVVHCPLDLFFLLAAFEPGAPTNTILRGGAISPAGCGQCFYMILYVNMLYYIMLFYITLHCMIV